MLPLVDWGVLGSYEISLRILFCRDKAFEILSITLGQISSLLLLVVARCLLLVHSVDLCYFLERRAWALVIVCILAVRSVIEIRIHTG